MVEIGLPKAHREFGSSLIKMQFGRENSVRLAVLVRPYGLGGWRRHADVGHVCDVVRRHHNRRRDVSATTRPRGTRPSSLFIDHGDLKKDMGHFHEKPPRSKIYALLETRFRVLVEKRKSQEEPS